MQDCGHRTVFSPMTTIWHDLLCKQLISFTIAQFPPRYNSVVLYGQASGMYEGKPELKRLLRLPQRTGNQSLHSYSNASLLSSNVTQMSSAARARTNAHAFKNSACIAHQWRHLLLKVQVLKLPLDSSSIRLERTFQGKE